MREIMTIRTIEEVVGYEAFDGTKFESKDECEKYEKLTAEGAIKEKFKKLFVGMIEESEMIWGGKKVFVGGGCGDGNGYALVRIKNENDLNICKAFYKITKDKSPREFTEDMIGKEIIVCVTDEYYESNRTNGEWDLTECYVDGTIEDNIETYKSRLMLLKDEAYAWK